MAGLTISDIVSIASSHGFSDKAGNQESLYGGILIPLRRPNSMKILDCFYSSGNVCLSSSRMIGSPVPDKDTLLFSIRAGSIEELNHALTAFAATWDSLPESGTEVITRIKARIGQQSYREEQMKLWGGACALTGIDIPELLIASHAVPWKNEDDVSRLDPYNGFLFEARIDKLFDRYLISFEDDGTILISPSISIGNRERLGIRHDMKLMKVYPENLYYLRQHRQRFLERIHYGGQ